MVERGHEFAILVPKGRRKLPVSHGLEVIECGPRVASPVLAVLTGLMGTAVKLPAVDVIIASMPTHCLFARILGAVRALPVVNYLLGDDVHLFDDGSYIRNQVWLSLYRLLARASLKSGLTVANSHWTAVRCVAAGGRRPAAIVPSGYDPALFHPSRLRVSKGNVPRIVTVGRRLRYKGLPDLIDALNSIDREFRLTVIAHESLDLSAAHFKYDIIQPGDDRELVEAYRTGDIFVSCSWFEGFGLPALEAQACGLAVVVTDSGGIREFLRDGLNALIVPPRDPKALAGALERLMVDEKLRVRLVAKGLETCTAFTWDRAVDRFEAVVSAVLEHRIGSD